MISDMIFKHTRTCLQILADSGCSKHDMGSSDKWSSDKYVKVDHDGKMNVVACCIYINQSRPDEFLDSIFSRPLNQIWRLLAVRATDHPLDLSLFFFEMQSFYLKHDLCKHTWIDVFSLALGWHCQYFACRCHGCKIHFARKAGCWHGWHQPSYKCEFVWRKSSSACSELVCSTLV